MGEPPSGADTSDRDAAAAHPLDIHLLSSRGLFPSCWEGLTAEDRIDELDDLGVIVRATASPGFVTCPYCRKGLFNA